MATAAGGGGCAMMAPATTSTSGSSTRLAQLRGRMVGAPRRPATAPRRSLIRARAQTPGGPARNNNEDDEWGAGAPPPPPPPPPPPAQNGNSNGFDARRADAASPTGRNRAAPVVGAHRDALETSGWGWGAAVRRARRAASGGGASGSASGTAVRPPPVPPPPAPPPGYPTAGSAYNTSANGNGASYSRNSGGATEDDWAPLDARDDATAAAMARAYAEELGEQRRRDGVGMGPSGGDGPPRDKWITPLLDFRAILGAFDPDQSRTEEGMADEALTNKESSRDAIAFVARILAIPLISGALVGRLLTDPILTFTLANDPTAFQMTSRQKVEGAQRLHVEEARVRMEIALGRSPPLDEQGMQRHLREFAREVREEERAHNEAKLMTLVSDATSLAVGTVMAVRDVNGRRALSGTLARLFEGLSDIAKAVLIILVADTTLGYHSEEGWTGFLDVVLGHWGIEADERWVVVFVGVFPVAVDALFKYWIFIGLNKISPGAVVTIKQIDRH